MRLVSPKPLGVVLSLGVVAALASLTPASLRAQEGDPLNRLEPNTRYVVEFIIDSARVMGVPTKPLVLKALYAHSRKADGRKIVSVVRSLFHAELDVRNVLGPSLNEADWGAAASAMQAGVPGSVLSQFGKDRQGKPLARALVVLVDLMQRGVPMDAASSAIFQLWQHGAGDGDFDGLWKGVEQDILSGQNPGTALQQRVREFPGRAPGSKATSGAPAQETQNSSS